MMRSLAPSPSLPAKAQPAEHIGRTMDTGARHIGIDIGRFSALVGVILIHTIDRSHFLPDGQPPVFGIDAGAVIDQLSRFAVPFFFASSGYFLARHVGKPLPLAIGHFLKRLLPIYLFWATVYVVVDKDRLLYLTRPGYIVRWLLNGGPTMHLWFLPALALCGVTALIMARFLSWRLRFTIAGALFVAGVLLGPYQSLYLHGESHALHLVSRDVLCFGLIFVIWGMWLAQSPPPPRTVAVALLAAGAVLQLTEGITLDNLRISPLPANDYLFSTLLYGMGAFMMTLTLRPFESPVTRAFGVLGLYTFGIFAVHALFIRWLPLFPDPIGLTQRAFLALYVLLASLMTVYVLSRIEVMRRFIR